MIDSYSIFVIIPSLGSAMVMSIYTLTDAIEGADIFLDYLSDQSKSMSVLYRTQIS